MSYTSQANIYQGTGNLQPYGFAIPTMQDQGQDGSVTASIGQQQQAPPPPHQQQHPQQAPPPYGLAPVFYGNYQPTQQQYQPQQPYQPHQQYQPQQPYQPQQQPTKPPQNVSPRRPSPPRSPQPQQHTRPSPARSPQPKPSAPAASGSGSRQEAALDELANLMSADVDLSKFKRDM